MKNSLKKGLLALSASSLLIGGAVLVSAQQTSADASVVEQVQRRGGKGGLGHRGGFGLPGGRMAEGSTITATFYDGNPEEGAAILNSYSLNVGVDSERTFAQNVREAMQDASFLTINTSAQSRTIELPSADETTNAPQRRRGFKAAPIRGLNEGSTVEAIFYSGNPEEGATATTTLNFTAGVDSELAFSNAFQEAAADATYVTINTSPQERTMDLSQIQERLENRGNGQRNFGPGGRRGGTPNNFTPAETGNLG